MQSFNRGIQEMIRKFDYPVYFVRRYPEIFCTCLDFHTQEADSSCPTCLGTGRKVKIKKARVTSSDNKGSFQNKGVTESFMTRKYFIDKRYDIADDDLIVDNGEVYNVYRIERKWTNNQTLVYRKVFASQKKNDTKVFLKNFNAIIGGDKK